ncbi:putative HTH-type transcriptional regulator YdgC [Alteripontixanthobacter maritimus]|uniref:Putative HTH-type transcriptional regulator YdgC n=1 Tax=Alteripontixanthobacter maritimus TaxID=2161824 RepID=A0A369Q2S4_9SPHN|nr:TetR/AcrR family transcriptional regulator [Alteripontixanthobacter maritimus]RDC59064.1 putative HTH-type transcriptional regulator YdgC [Alteripontixanthobacter maritimus]
MISATETAKDPPAKQPRTERGRRTRQKLIDAAAVEFGEKGFHEASIIGITGRAGTALGSFYTYFDSKDEIFRSLVKELGDMVKTRAAAALEPEQSALEAERAALHEFLEFSREHKEIYRIIDESEFVDPQGYRHHYERTARRIMERLAHGVAAGDLRSDVGEVEAWAIMGMNVFLGLRFSIWAEDADPIGIADTANALLKAGISAHS